MPSPKLLNHRYRILKALGEGGFGRTFLAEDTHMPSLRKCVIKQLKPKSHRPEVHQLLQDRFAREAAVLETVGRAHSQIPTLYAYFVRQNEFYLVQEWIEGKTLSAQTTRTESGIKQLLASLLETLVFVHRQNIIHRDIKPENIIVRSQNQSPCLIDFGAVKEVMSTVLSPSGAFKTSLVIGTPGFMPPEQLAGHPVFSSDLYSLGLTTVYLLIGKSPAEIPTDSRTGQLLWQQYAPNISPQLVSVLTKATSAQSRDRYATATEMLAALNPTSVQTARPLASSNPNVAPPKPIAIQTVAQTELSTPTESFNTFSFSLLLKGLAIASIAGICLLIQLGPRSQNNLNNSTTESTETNTEEQTNESNKPITAQTSRISSDNPASPLAEAQELYEEGKNAAALKKIDLALNEDPELVDAIALKGDILANQTQQDRPAAIKLYTQALSIAPNNLEVLTKRCKTYAALKDWAAAEADCTQAIEIDQNSVELYGRRGDIRSAQGNYEGAVNDYTQAIEINASAGQKQKSQSLYFRRFTALGKLNRLEEALADMEKVRSLPPTETIAD